MKKIEKEFYVNFEAFGCLRRGEWDYISMSVTNSPDELRNDKITISWEVPEKKITISESEFNEALKNWDHFLRYNDTHKALVDDIKKAMFGGGE